MSLPTWLLIAIVRAVEGEAEQERLAREWQRVIPRMDATAARIRGQVLLRRNDRIVQWRTSEWNSLTREPGV